MTKSEIDAENRSVTPTDNVRLRNMQAVEQGDDVVCHEVITEGLRAPCAASVSSRIDKDDRVMRMEGTHLVAPVVAVGKASMQENNRCGMSAVGGRKCGIEEPNAVNLRVVLLFTSDRCGCRRKRLPALLCGERDRGKKQSTDEFFEHPQQFKQTASDAFSKKHFACRRGPCFLRRRN